MEFAIEDTTGEKVLKSDQNGIEIYAEEHGP